MNIELYYSNKEALDKRLQFFEDKRQLIKIEPNKDLIKAHIDKAEHNLNFFGENRDKRKYNDWLIVILYYALYHLALALLVNKNVNSKNHTATLLFLIKHYSIAKDDAELIHELSISKDDAELYTELKKDRHSASYSTSIIFTNEKIDEYRKRVIDFMQKTKEILEN